QILDNNNVTWQTGEYGKVDQGGAGTVASEISAMNIETVDVGVPILSMHSTVELAAKSDIYMMYKACTAFFES
ncbi:MAG: aminopeptidase, partial [Clostridia bacterium]